MRQWHPLLLAVTALLGCSGPTELVVVTSTDLSAPVEIDEIDLRIAGPDGRTSTRSAPLSGQGAVELPATVVLRHASGPLGPVQIRAVGRLDGSEVVRRDVVARFVEG